MCSFEPITAPLGHICASELVIFLSVDQTILNSSFLFLYVDLVCICVCIYEVLALSHKASFYIQGINFLGETLRGFHTNRVLFESLMCSNRLHHQLSCSLAMFAVYLMTQTATYCHSSWSVMWNSLDCGIWPASHGCWWHLTSCHYAFLRIDFVFLWVSINTIRMSIFTAGYPFHDSCVLCIFVFVLTSKCLLYACSIVIVYIIEYVCMWMLNVWNKS